jgi:hypothetical protein
MKLKLKKCWKWAAMDKNGEWYLYSDKPFCNNVFNNVFNTWSINGSLSCGFAFDLPKVKDWKKSLRRIE